MVQFKLRARHQDHRGSSAALWTSTPFYQQSHILFRQSVPPSVELLDLFPGHPVEIRLRVQNFSLFFQLIRRSRFERLINSFIDFFLGKDEEAVLAGMGNIGKDIVQIRVLRALLYRPHIFLILPFYIDRERFAVRAHDQQILHGVVTGREGDFETPFYQLTRNRELRRPLRPVGISSRFRFFRCRQKVSLGLVCEELSQIPNAVLFIKSEDWD